MIDLQVLGILQVRKSDGAVVESVLAHPKQAALLVYLGLAPKTRAARRDSLLGIFWPESDEKRARGSLKHAVYSLRQALGSQVVITRGEDEVGLDVTQITCDVWSFDAAVADDKLDRAVELYTGPFFDGFFLRGSVEFDRWVEEERTRLARSYGWVLEQLLDRATGQSDIRAAAKWCRRLQEHNPHSTRVTLRVMEVLDAVGDRAGALTLADQHAARMLADLDAAPSPDVLALAERLRKRPVARARPGMHDAAGSSGAGMTARLKAALADRYNVEEVLGVGGMATVYLAHDVKQDRKVAVKVLQPELAAVIGTGRFLSEIKLTANLSHPHIIPLHDSGEVFGPDKSGPFLFYVMPYVEGESLRAKLQRQKHLGIEETVKIAEGVAAALDYAHGRGVVHRDIKPENVLLHEGQALVLDFGIGIAMAVAGDARLTKTGLTVGTPQYMSPEQATGDRELTAQSDVYSLGAMVYEMLAGEPPYTGSTAQMVLAKAIRGKPEPLTDIRDTVPPHIAAAVSVALSRVPADRFASASLFVEALRNPNFAPATPAEAQRSSVDASRSTLRMVAYRSLKWAFPVGVGLLFVATVLNWGARAPSEQPAPTRFVINLPSGHVMNEGQHPNLALSPDGRTIVYYADEQLWIRSFDEFVGLPVAGTQRGTTPFFSPDGEWVGFTQASELKRVRVDGGPVLTIANARAAYGASWGERDEIVYSTGNAGLWQVAVSGGEARPITSVLDHAGESAHVWPQILPGGAAVLFTALGPSGGWDDARIVIQEIESGERMTMLEQGTFARYVSTGHLVYVRSDGSVLVVPFDLRERRPTGSPISVASGVRVAARGGAASLSVSDNGSLAFVLETNVRNHRFSWVDRIGGSPVQVGDALNGAHPRLSPDGRRVATVVRDPINSDIWLLDANTGEPDRFTFDLAEDESPVWSPDGERLAYASAGAEQESRIFIADVQRRTDPQLLSSRQHHTHLSDWSPDGQWIAAFEIHPENQRDIWAFSVHSSAPPLAIAVTQAWEYNAVFSPNGGSLAYASNETGQFEVYVVTFPGLVGKQQISNAGGNFPKWDQDGDELYFVNGDTLYTATMSDGADARRWSSPIPLFAQPGIQRFEVTSGGQRFVLLTENPEAPANAIHVVLDALNR